MNLPSSPPTRLNGAYIIPGVPYQMRSSEKLTPFPVVPLSCGHWPCRMCALWFLDCTTYIVLALWQCCLPAVYKPGMDPSGYSALWDSDKKKCCCSRQWHCGLISILSTSGQAGKQAVYIVVRHRVKPAVAEQVAALSSLARTGIDKLGGDLLLLLLLWTSSSFLLLWATQINMCFAILWSQVQSAGNRIPITVALLRRKEIVRRTIFHIVILGHNMQMIIAVICSVALWLWVNLLPIRYIVTSPSTGDHQQFYVSLPPSIRWSIIHGP